MTSVHFESRGYLLPSDSKGIHSELIARARESYEVALKDIPDIETKELNRLVRQDMERATRDIVGRTPLIIILIHRL